MTLYGKTNTSKYIQNNNYILTSTTEQDQNDRNTKNVRNRRNDSIKMNNRKTLLNRQRNKNI